MHKALTPLLGCKRFILCTPFLSPPSKIEGATRGGRVDIARTHVALRKNDGRNRRFFFVTRNYFSNTMT